MRKTWAIATITALLTILAFAAVACGDDGDEEGTATATMAADETPMVDETPMAGAVGATLTEYQIILDVESAPAGSVTFNASNIGQEDHELVVIKTDLAPDALPTADDGSVDEAGEGIEVLGEIEEFAPDGEESLTLDLDAGSYVLICNVVEEEDDGAVESHYRLGMTTAFEVTG